MSAMRIFRKLTVSRELTQCEGAVVRLELCQQFEVGKADTQRTKSFTLGLVHSAPAGV